MAKPPEAISQQTSDILGPTMTRRAVAITIARIGLGLTVGAVVLDKIKVTDNAYVRAESAATKAHPVPAQPTPTEGEVIVAKRVDSLYADRQKIVAQQSHIPSGVDRDTIILNGVLTQGKQQQINEKDGTILAFKASPEYKTAIQTNLNAQREFEEKVASNRQAIIEETDKLKEEAGVGWYNPMYRGLGALAMMGSVMITGYLPILFKRPSWPLKEVPIAQSTQVPTETPQTV